MIEKPSKESKKKELLVGERMREGYYDPKWFRMRKKILKRDNHKCKVCSSEANLNVHHKYYIWELPVWDYPEKDLYTLCRRCHETIHRFRKAKYGNKDELCLDVLLDIQYIENEMKLFAEEIELYEKAILEDEARLRIFEEEIELYERGEFLEETEIDLSTSKLDLKK